MIGHFVMFSCYLLKAYYFIIKDCKWIYLAGWESWGNCLLLRRENDNQVILHGKLIYFQKNKKKIQNLERDSEFKSNSCSAWGHKLNSTTYTLTDKCLQFRFQEIWCLQHVSTGNTCTCCTDVYLGNTHIHLIKNENWKPFFSIFIFYSAF